MNKTGCEKPALFTYTELVESLSLPSPLTRGSFRPITEGLESELRVDWPVEQDALPVPEDAEDAVRDPKSSNR